MALTADPPKSRSLLKLFGDVRPGEGGTVLLLALNVFLLLAAYYLLKVAREPLILLGGGAEVKSYASVGQTVLLIGATSGYGWLATRVRRLVLISFVTLFFAANLVIFWVLGEAGVHLGIPFFLWVGIFNIVTIAQFWSFAADTYTEEQGKRLFPIVGIGSSVGAVAGAWLAEPLIRHRTRFSLMLMAAAILLAALALTYLVDRREMVDALFKRSGDTLSAGLVWVSAHFALGTRSVLAINVGLAVCWLGLAIVLGRNYAKREAAEPGVMSPPLRNR